MLKEVINDAIARGESLKNDIVGQILKSATFHELIGQKRFADTVAKVIQTKHEVTHSIQKNIQEVLRAMRIPSKQQISSYERRIEMLERKIDSLGRHVMKKKLKLRGRR